MVITIVKLKTDFLATHAQSCIEKVTRKVKGGECCILGVGCRQMVEHTFWAMHCGHADALHITRITHFPNIFFYLIFSDKIKIIKDFHINNLSVI